MLEVHFHELVEELEVSAADNQRGYRLKVALLAALGYAYIVAAVVLLLFAAYLIVAEARAGRHVLGVVVWAVPLVLLSVLALRALWVSLDPPEGTVITKEQAAHLFALFG